MGSVQVVDTYGLPDRQKNERVRQLGPERGDSARDFQALRKVAGEHGLHAEVDLLADDLVVFADLVGGERHAAAAKAKSSRGLENVRKRTTDAEDIDYEVQPAATLSCIRLRTLCCGRAAAAG